MQTLILKLPICFYRWEKIERRNRDMGGTSKDLFHLEHKDSLFSAIGNASTVSFLIYVCFNSMFVLKFESQ